MVLKLLNTILIGTVGAIAHTNDELFGPLKFSPVQMLEFGIAEGMSLDTEIDMVIFLSTQDPAHLYQLLRRVSDPSSAEYGHFRTQEEIASIVAMDQEEIDDVTAYFKRSLPSHSFVNLSNTKDHLSLRAKVSDIQRLFDGKLGHSGTYTEEHRGSDVYIAHKSLHGDAAYEDLKTALPEYIADKVDLINFYMPEHVYIDEANKEYYTLMKSNLCTAFESMLVDDELPTGSWKSSVGTYEALNPISITTNENQLLHVLNGTRGVKDRGIVHFIPTDEHGHIAVLTETDAERLCKASEEVLWTTYIQQEYKTVESIDIMVKQDDVPVFMTYPFTRDFVEAECHSSCSINGASAGTCLMFTAKFPLKPYRESKVLLRSKLTNGQFTVWGAGPGNALPFTTNTIVDMEYIRDLYAMEDFEVADDYDNNTIVVTAFLEEYFDPRDTMKYLFDQNISVANFSDRLQIVGTNNPNEGRMTGIEASLDVEIVMGLTPNYKTIYWQVPGRELGTDSEPFLRLMYQLSTWNTTVAPLPAIVSISYGDEELEGIARHLRRLDIEMAKVGIMGVTVISASGDDGANGMKSRKDVPDRCSFNSPGYPATLPSLTSVGATQLSNRSSHMCNSAKLTLPPIGGFDCSHVGEVVAATDMGGSLITSGGGFSYYFDQSMDQVWYQNAPMKQYKETVDALQLNLAPGTFYNKHGRGFPDIAVMGTNVPVILGGRWGVLSGTSVSAPVACAIFANLRLAVKNRLQVERINLGFMNPIIYDVAYSYTDAVTDVTVGSNRCGYKANECCAFGFTAVPGWDPASGLGSLNVSVTASRMFEVIKSRQQKAIKQLIYE